VLLSFAGLVTAYIAGDGLIPLAVIEGLHRGVVAGAVAVGAGLVAWSLTGLRPRPVGRRPDAGIVGLALAAAGLLAEAAVQVGPMPRAAALPVAVAAWAVAGLGMGLAYGRLSSQAFDGLAPGQVPAVGSAVAFAETAAVVVGSLLGGGVYSLATGLGATTRSSIGGALLLAAAVALVSTLVGAAAGRSP
jgi:hypothetical protein